MNTYFGFRECKIQSQKIPRDETAKDKNFPIWSHNRDPQLWSIVPADLISLPNVILFKSKIKQWECTERPCKLYKTYLKNISYVERRTLRFATIFGNGKPYKNDKKCFLFHF